MSNEDISQALAGNYLLVDVTIRRFSGFKKDKQASEDVTAHAGAQHNAAKVVKDILAGARNELKEVNATQDAIRSYLYNHTLPWSSSVSGRNTGARLLAAAESINFLKHYKTLHTEYTKALNDFVAAYASRKSEAMQNLGSLADPSDYPDVSEMGSFFAVDLDMNPVPATSDFSRLAIPAALTQALGDRIAGQQKVAMDNAMKDLSERIVTELKRMAVQLGKFGDGEKTRLYGSLIDNMKGLVSLLRSSNFSNDQRLDELADRLTECTKHDIATIKNNVTVAKDISLKASAISSDIENDLYF